MAGRAKKEFQEYLSEPSSSHVSQGEYLAAPATAFLRYSIEAKCAIDLCARQFPKKNDGTFTKDSEDSLQHLVSAMLPLLMGHFETFQRYLFAGIFDRSIYLNGFDIDKFSKRLSKDHNVSFDIARLAAHRQSGLSSVGLLLANSVNGWHNPHKVNSLFNTFGLNYQLFKEEDCSKLRVLWQLRHSIVYTGGTLTLADAQKVPELYGLGERKIVFQKNFIFEVARKLHPLVRDAIVGFGTAFKANLVNGLEQRETKKLMTF